MVIDVALLMRKVISAIPFKGIKFYPIIREMSCTEQLKFLLMMVTLAFIS